MPIYFNYTDLDKYKKKYEEDDIYSYLDYVDAYVSDTKLIDKCLSISKIPIEYAIKMIVYTAVYKDTCDIYLNIESYKLLHKCGCRLNHLLLIACHVNDSQSIQYIMDNISESDLVKVMSESLPPNLNIILLIDKIMHMNDPYLKVFLKNIIMLVKYYKDSYMVIMQCYYITKYLTNGDDKQAAKELHKEYDTLLNRTVIPTNDIPLIRARLDLFNDVMNFHFRPRGAHTKAPSVF
jgi:hypothetical protein